MVNQPHLFVANMPFGVTQFSHKIYHLHMLSFSICLAIFAVVSIVFIYFLVKYSKSRHPKPSIVHSRLWIEIIWVGVPLLLLVIMGIPATLFLIKINEEQAPELNIKITGYQWKWQYEYLDYGIEFFSNLATPLSQIQGKSNKNRWYLREVDRPLVVPIHQKIRFLVTSHDVIHSWWMPALGIKRDAIPGFIYETWATLDRPGVYRGQCAELCGVGHGFMPIVVIAKTPADFAQWLAENKPKTILPEPSAPTAKMDRNTLMSEGKAVYDSQCSACHQPNGQGMPPTFPALQGGKITTGLLATHIDIVLNGAIKTSMPAFGKQLSDEQIAAVITYERNSWGNDNQIKFGSQAGGLVQPEDIHAAR